MNLIKLRDFTEHVPFKAVIAVTGVTTTSLVESFCSLGPFSDLTCVLVRGVPNLVMMLVCMMALDMVTGVLAARAEGERVHSRKLGEGMKRKVAMLAVIASAVILDATLNENGVPTGSLIYRLTVSWFIGVEALSLYENAERTGLPIPSLLKSVIDKLLEKGEREIEVRMERGLREKED